MSASADDHIYVQRIASGDRAALGGLYDRYASAMMAIGMRCIGDRQEVEDVLHDVFMEVWRNAHSYDEERGSVRTWLFLLMRSRTLDAARKVRRTRTDSLGEAALDDDDLITSESPYDSAERSAIRNKVQSLPKRLRQVLLLTYFTGLTCREVAERIEIPVGTVKSRLRTAREAMKQALADGRGGVW
jgi:RNA polymerase sigma-70 factor (ECF subfamily)